MSQILTELSAVKAKIEQCSEDTLLRLRIFAQFKGISHSHRDGNDIFIRVVNVPDFNTSDTTIEECKFLINECIYDEVFIEGKLGQRPHCGDILDMRCCYRKFDDIIEIVHLKVITIADLSALTRFIAAAAYNSEIRSFLQ